MPMVDLDKCINCGLCKKTCPVLNSQTSSQEILPIKVVAAKNADSETVSKSSSGGIFSLLAQFVLTSQGSVYGVRLSPSLNAEHIRIDDIRQLGLLQGSKYLQSDASKIYKSVKADLNSERLVLYSGTPCQIGALHQYLGKDYSNLICVEVICHGVPSNLAFKKYIDYLEDKHKEKICSINFRDKKNGWENYRVTFTFKNGSCFSQKSSDNLYTLGYVNNLFVRESCTACKFKGLRSNADFTLGDMWGIESIIPSYNVSNGVSMISVNTPKGEAIFNQVQHLLKDCIEIKYDDVKLHNACIYKSVTPHPKRTYVLNNLQIYSIHKLIKESLGITALTIIKKQYTILKNNVIQSLIGIKHKLLK